MNISISQYVFSASFAAFFVLFVMIFFIFTNRLLHKKVLYYFGAATITLLIATIFECICCVDVFKDHKSILLLFSTAILFSCWPLALLFVFELADISKPFSRRQTLFIFMPAIANMILSLFSVTSGWMFSYTDKNEFVYGPIWFFPYIIEGIYIVLLIFGTSWRFRTNIWDSFHVVFLIFVTIASTIFQHVFKQNFLITTALSITLLFYFLDLHIQFYRHDSLTQLHNRKALFTDLKKHSKDNKVILTMKIENLNIFYDTSGNEGGNLAILTTVKNMEDSFDKIGRLYRTANDEFKILFLNKEKDNITSAIENFQKAMAQTSYSVSWSISELKAK